MSDAVRSVVLLAKNSTANSAAVAAQMATMAIWARLVMLKIDVCTRCLDILAKSAVGI
jgi:hypothetical protein